VTTTRRSLVVKVTCGTEDPKDAERLNQGFTVAATAAASGVDVSLWLTGDASWLAVPGRAEEFALEGAAPLADLLGAVLAAGRVTVCSQCAARRSLTESDLVAGARIAGAAVFTEEVLQDDVQALVY
jgi:predicted peroxiredoxin